MPEPWKKYQRGVPGDDPPSVTVQIGGGGEAPVSGVPTGFQAPAGEPPSHTVALPISSEEAAPPDGPWAKYRPEGETTAYGVAGNFLGGVNEVLARFIEFPGKVGHAITAPAAKVVANVGRELVGAEPNLEPIPEPTNVISETLRGERKPFGIDMTPPEADTAVERVARRSGEIVAETVPFAAVPFAGAVARTAAPVAKQATSTTQRVLQSLVDPAARAPVRTAATETAAAAGAGVGSGVAREADPGDPTTEALAMLAGGVTPGAAATAARLTNLPYWAYRGIRAGLTPFTKGGATPRAERRLQGLARDPEGAAAAVGEDAISDLTPAQKTGDPRLLALERSIIESDAKLEGEYAEQTRRTTEQLRKALEDVGTDVPPEEARKFIQERKDYLLGLLEQRAAQAADIARQRIADLTPEMRQSDASRIVREEIETALSEAKTQESQLWAAVPKDARVSTENSRRAYRAFAGQLTPEEIAANPDLAALALPRAQLDKMPPKARQFLDAESNSRLADEDAVNEVWGLRSDLLEAARNARASGEMNTARIADKLADSLLDDLGARAGALQGEAGENLRLALDFSREVAQRFRQGPVGRVLGSERAGGQSVAPEMTLETTVGAGGTKGAVAAGKLAESAPTETTETGIKQYLLSRFTRKAVPDGTINPQAARQFVEDNADLIDRFPGLRKDMIEAGTAQEFASRAAQRAEKTAKRLETKNISRTAQFLGADPGTEIDRVFKSADPVRFARELTQLVRKDETGRAARGLKTSVVDYLIRTATKEADEIGPVLSSKELNRLLYGKTRDGIREILSDQEFGRVRRIASELSKIEASQGRLPDIGGAMTDLPSSIMSFLVRSMAARSGARMGAGTSGASLLTAGFASQRAKRLLEGLTQDRARLLLTEAIRDPELFRSLLTSTTTKAGQKAAGQRLHAWLGAAGAELLPEIEDE